MHKGFTLIEFVVIITIFAIMSAVALFNFQGFQSNVAINNLAHDMALTIRQAQVFGWSGKATDAASQVDVNGNNIRYADGVYFSYNHLGNSFTNQFILYTKTNSTPGLEAYVSGDTINDIVKIQGDVHIVGISVGAQTDLALDPITHHTTGGSVVASDVSIAFSRPLPEAMFFISGVADPVSTDQYMAIYIAANNKSDPFYVDHTILISRFGEIEVQ